MARVLLSSIAEGVEKSLDTARTSARATLLCSKLNWIRHMPLSPGDKLGACEIVSLLGKGGMGEVWKARDLQLGRDVAIKVSAKQFYARFEREARAIAALNHPNVCTLYHIGPNYLVMEYIEGPKLAERIKEGPIPLEEALGIAKQIAAALEAAHEKSIVHRDLKPANVKIRPDGSVKVLDFGLATAAGEEIRPGYLRKNGVPYSDQVKLTEYWNLMPGAGANGKDEKWLVLSQSVDDPVYLTEPWVLGLNFKKEADGSKWDPQPCSARW